MVEGRNQQCLRIRLALDHEGFLLQGRAVVWVVAAEDEANPAAHCWIHASLDPQQGEPAIGAALGRMHGFMQQHGAGDAELPHQRRDLEAFVRRDEASVGPSRGLADDDPEAMAEQGALQLLKIGGLGREASQEQQQEENRLHRSAVKGVAQR